MTPLQKQNLREEFKKEYLKLDNLVEIDKPIYIADWWLSRLDILIAEAVEENNKKLVEEINKYKKENDFGELPDDMKWGKTRVEDYHFGYNEAVETVINLISSKK